MLRTAFLGFSLALAVVFGAAKSADAAPFTVTIHHGAYSEEIEDRTVPALPGPGVDTDPRAKNIFYGNGDFNGSGVDITVTADTNRPGSPGSANINQTTFELNHAGTETVVLKIFVNDYDFTQPDEEVLKLRNTLAVTLMGANSSARARSTIADDGGPKHTGWVQVDGDPGANETTTRLFVRDLNDPAFDLQSLLIVTLAPGETAKMLFTTEATPTPLFAADVHDIPEPASLAVWGLGLGAMGLVRLRRRRARVTC